MHRFTCVGKDCRVRASPKRARQRGLPALFGGVAISERTRRRKLEHAKPRPKKDGKLCRNGHWALTNSEGALGETVGPPTSLDVVSYFCLHSRMTSGLFIDPTTLPSDAGGAVQLLFLLLVYGKILMDSSSMISEGSELLLLVPSLAGVVGSVVLPVLGAVPDGAIVLFSGMGDNAQEELTVGVGALAGSTIMLLTIPWCLSIIGGRVNLDPVSGEALYKRPSGASKYWSKVSTKWHMKYNGIGILPPVRMAALIMLWSAANFLIIQIPAFVYAADVSTAALAEDERPWAGLGLATTALSFVLYLLYQWRTSNSDELKNDKIAEITLKNISRGKLSLLGALGPEFEEAIREHHALRRCSWRGRRESSEGMETGASAALPLASEYGSLADDSRDLRPLKASVMERLVFICRPFFHRYDWDMTGTLDRGEIWQLFADLGEAPGPEEFRELWEEYDRDGDGQLNFQEFLDLVIDHAMSVLHEGHHHERRSSWRGEEGVGRKQAGPVHKVEAEAEAEEEEEEEEIPEDLKDLPWETQQSRLMRRAFYMMAEGTLLILVFADPLIGVLSEVGARTGIPAFYVSFVLSPLVSNGAEVLAAYSYAQKKSSKTISISLATLMGAAVMNATFVLFIFLLLIYVKRLAWTFSAETVAILFVQIVVGLLALSKSQSLWHALFILFLYPVSLVLVYVMENIFGFD